ncbi:peptidylprolyl isomerase PpiC [Salinispirillum marinum]
MKASIKAQIAAANQKARLGKKGATTAAALHILVRDEQKALTLLSELNNGADFGKLARAHSICPSAKQGGDLGEFRRGTMVPAFDKAVFSETAVGILGPVKTKFGYHLIKVLYRK